VRLLCGDAVVTVVKTVRERMSLCGERHLRRTIAEFVAQAQLRGHRIRLTDDQRRRLAVLGHQIGRRALMRAHLADGKSANDPLTQATGVLVQVNRAERQTTRRRSRRRQQQLSERSTKSQPERA